MSKKSAAAQQHQLIGVNDNINAVYKYNPHPDAKWFKEGKNIGLFIHYGISTVLSCVDLSWGMMANKPWENERVGCEYCITPNVYWDMSKDFNPLHFEEEIRKLLKKVKEAGFTYAVFTTKHHDGFAMWPSKHGDFNIGLYHKELDLVKIFTDACREAGLKVGLYYSPPDWYYNKDYMSFNFGSDRCSDKRIYDANHHAIEELPKMTEEFKNGFYQYVRNQITELLTNYGKIDLLWFDGKTDEPEKVIARDELYKMQPGMVINDRLHADGDFTTTEVDLPEERPDNVWEHCDILAEGPWWAFMYQSKNYRSLQWLWDRYQFCCGQGGNFLINIGPMADGTIPESFYERLEEFKKALEKGDEKER